MNLSTTEFVLFVDRALGQKAVPEALCKAGAKVEVHIDHFPCDALDQDWLPVVAQRSWVVLTKDKNIGSKHLEVLAITQYGAKVFVLNSGNLTSKKMADIFVNSIDRISAFSLRHNPPFIAKINQEGKITMWKKRDELLKQIPTS